MQVTSLRSFATLLRQYRHARGLTQTELAGKAQISRRAIVDLERGASLPHDTTLTRLADALHLSTQKRQHLKEAVHQARFV